MGFEQNFRKKEKDENFFNGNMKRVLRKGFKGLP
jgi:hypothetical protein